MKIRTEVLNMRRSTMCVVVLLVIGSAVSLGRSQDVMRPGVADAALERVAGHGTWKTTRWHGSPEGWDVQLERASDDSIRGRLVTFGSSSLGETRVEGRIDGQEIYGALVDANNQQIGSFTGSIAKHGMSGTYTTNDGDQGEWSWNGGGFGRRGKSEEAPRPPRRAVAHGLDLAHRVPQPAAASE